MIRSLKEIRNKNCKDCILHKTAEFVCLPGYGKVPADIMLIGEAPGHREDDSGKPFVGKAGKVLDIILSEVGIERDEVYITNIVHCRPPENRTPTMDEMRSCRKYLEREIKRIKPKIIITLGNVAIKGLFNTNNLSTKNERGKVLDYDGVKVIPTYHPAVVLRKQYYFKLIYQDIVDGLAICYPKKGQFAQLSSAKNASIGKYRVIRPRDKSWAKKRLISSRVLVVDVETTGLDMFDQTQELEVVGLTNKEGEGYVFTPEDENLDTVDEIINSSELVVGHNFKFDMKWLRRYGITVYPRIFDTMVAIHLLDENYPDKSLEHLARTNLGNLGAYLDEWKEKMALYRKKGTLPKLKEWVAYNGGDIDATFHLYQRFRRSLRKEGLEKLMRFEMRNLKVLTEMEIQGFKIDKKNYESLDVEYRTKLRKSENRMKRLLGDINLNSTQQLSKKLYKGLKLPVIKKSDKTQQPSCDEDTLKKLIEITKRKDVKKTLQELLDFRGLEKLYSVYIKGLKANGLLKKDGKVHCNYKICGTVTGRLSCSDPNLQNIPRDGEIKKMFTSSFPDGRIIQGDYSQAELRILAHMSRDRELIRAFKSGRDIHTEVATKVFHKPYEKITEKERKFTKQVNFGIIYLISAEGLASKLNCDPEEAEKLIKDWFREFPKARSWIRNTKEEVVYDGYTTNIFGRKRRFFNSDPRTGQGREDQRQGVNSPIQGGAGDLTKWVGTKMHYQMRKLRYKARVVGNVHDAVMIDCPRREVRNVSRLLIRTAINPPIRLRVPLEMEVKVGANWGELKKMEVNV